MSFRLTPDHDSAESQHSPQPSVETAAEGETRSASALKGVCVLAVDDDLFSLELIEAILAPHGVQVLTCNAAAEALACARREMPDLIVADIAMPHEDGNSFIKQLRQLAPDEGGLIPAIAVSGYAREEDRRRALAAGFQIYLTKPIDPQEFLTTLAALAKVAGDPTLRGH
jgi:CheY-like chemotaxis protein